MALTLVLAHKLRWLWRRFPGFPFRTIFLSQFLPFISKSTNVIITTLEILSSAPAFLFHFIQSVCNRYMLVAFFLAQC